MKINEKFGGAARKPNEQRTKQQQTKTKLCLLIYWAFHGPHTKMGRRYPNRKRIEGMKCGEFLPTPLLLFCIP